MSAVGSTGIQDKKNLSIGRGRGKRSSPQRPQSQNTNDISKSESQSKTTENTLPTRVSKGRGWKRPDQALYVPKALRKEQSTKNHSEEDKDKTCKPTQKDEVFSDSENSLAQRCADSQTMARIHPAVSKASGENQSICDVFGETGKEQPENCLSKSNTSSNSCANDSPPLDMKKTPVNTSDIKEDLFAKKSLSENEKVNEEQIEETPSQRTTEDEGCVQSSGKSFQETDKEEEKQNHDNEKGMESQDSVNQIQFVDTCQPESLVRSCIENSNEGQIPLENQEIKEGVNLNHQQPVADSCQSSSPVRSCIDNSTENEEVKSQDLHESVMTLDQQQEMTDSESMPLEESSSNDDNLQKEKSELLENQGVMALQNKVENRQTCDIDSCQSLECTGSAEINTELEDQHDHDPTDLKSTTSSKDIALTADFKTDEETHDEECFPKEILNDNLQVTIDQSCSPLVDNFNEQSNDRHVKSDDLICEKSGSTVEELYSEAKESNSINEVPCKNQEENTEETTKESTESEGGINERTICDSQSDVRNNDDVKIESDVLVNNEGKVDEKETKQKKKSKKKKDGEVENKDEKKKKKSKKKESESEESKDKEKDEKHSKLKKKGKMKAVKEDSGGKLEEKKSKEKTKNEKEEKCKNCSEDNEYDDESWESKFTEDGDCLDPELLNELTEVTGIKKPSKHKTQFDYYSLPSKEVTLDDDSGYGHIVELYDFSPELKTQDLVQLLASFKNQGYNITWVDDTHALAVFSSEIAAKQAIQMCSSPIMKLRPVSQGSSESKSKAKTCFSSLQPYKPRPQTTNLAAHRLVTGALGVRSTMSKEERERERVKLKEAKEQKRQEKQRKAEVWGD